MFYVNKRKCTFCDFNYISYILPFYLIVLAGYMLKKKKKRPKKLWNPMVNTVFKQALVHIKLSSFDITLEIFGILLRGYQKKG